MKVGSVSFPAPAAPAVNEADREERAATPPAAPATPASPREGVGADAQALQAAQSELARKDEIDHARVAEIRAALQRGEIVFDAAKLARLIERHHGGRG